MNIFKEFEARIAQAIGVLQARSVVPADLPLEAVRVEPPRDVGHGDLSTNAAMVLAKPAKMAPRQIAEHLVVELERLDDVDSVEIAGPGFINIRLAGSVWPAVVRAILADPDAYGRTDIGRGEPINIEFVSANPTGPLHVGHCRGAVFGDALARLMSFTGYNVCREYYINDAGAQVDVLARSAYLRYREALGEPIGTIPEGLYPGDYLIPVGEALAEAHGKALLSMPEAEWLPIVRKRTITMMMDHIRADLAKLGIGYDVFFSERSLTEGEEDQVAATIAWLEARGLVYVGRLPPPKGKLPDDWEDREQTLFRATDFGDDIDRALGKPDGSYTYFASDMAYHRNKFERGFNTLIDVWGADHGGYVKRLQAAVRALSEGRAQLDVKICQLVRLFRGGEPVKMSKRAGEFVTLREIVDEVGADAFRFMMLYRKNDAPLDFDFIKVTEQSRDNPVFYVQYAHARAHSVFRNVAEVFAELAEPSSILAAAPIELLTDQAEIQVFRRLSQYPRIIEAAAEAHEPHRIGFYLYDLASDFHSLWTRGKESPQLRFINPDSKSMTQARMAMVWAVANVLASGLGILGVQAIREMR